MSIKEQIKAIENKLTLLNEDEIPFEEKIEIYKNALNSITHLKKDNRRQQTNIRNTPKR